ncbi:amino acid/polyamine/organocation transporter, APC superfamily [Micromonospora matsumotoense]|uniref:Amino acid/polyamine/organocation transporter, APC superfamily n=1 Tax=Micromonospora matsumotoense TaxID=121616 RepID=A0A1C5AUR2_9ACTN|nr:APC family permease [Micromonospora matsumotoense]SCF48774.1 amino acid/polyamine/organocation transporter, APC superfamily [Micromonospora matsumotoense]
MRNPDIPATSSNVASTLARSRLGTTAVVIFVMAAAAPLTVTAGGATSGFAITGSEGIPVAYLAVAIILALFTVGYVSMSRYLVNAGSFYSYISRGIGRPSGVSAAMIAILAYNAMQIGLYGGFGAVLSGWLNDRFDVSVAWWVCALAGWAVVGVLGVMRIDLNGIVLAVMLAAEVAVAAVFAIVMVAHPVDGVVSFSTLSPGFLVASGIGAALVTAVTGFVGFEATTVFSEETRDPRRTVARATYIAVAVTGLLYGGSAWALTVATGPDKIVSAAQEHSTELIFTLVQPHLGQFFVDLGHMLFVTSLFAALLSFHHTVGRYLFSLGRERVLPGVLGRTSRRTGAPKAGSIAQSVLAFVVLVGYAIAQADPIIHLFFWVTVSGGLGVLILMTLTSVAVIGFFARDHRGEPSWRRIGAPVLATAALVWMLYLTVAQFDVLLGVGADSPLRWLFPASFAAAAALGLVRAGLLKAWNPDVYVAVGMGANAAPASPFTLVPSLAEAGQP